MIGELVMKKEETARRRQDMLAMIAGGAVAPPEAVRNEVKVSKLTKQGKMKNGRLIINGYVLTQKLGAGAYGTVHLAVSLAHSKKYAMKIVSRALLRRKKGFGSLKTEDEVRASRGKRKPRHGCNGLALDGIGSWTHALLLASAPPA
jgi:ribosomal protein L18E